MRVVLQRVSEASVDVAEITVGAIGYGLLLLVGVGHDDTETTAISFAEKIARLRIFEDDAGKMNFSAIDKRASILVVSQFTLLADTSHGRRPSFINAAAPSIAELLIEKFIATLREFGLNVAQGQFGAHMRVSLVNDGPVTLVLDG
jgi:D-aminoacyl-tRNA deacylase